MLHSVSMYIIRRVDQRLTRLSYRPLVTTDAERSDIAAPAKIGNNSKPKAG